MFAASWSADVCLHSITGFVAEDARPIHTFLRRGKNMGKGNNSQKNDKKDKKPKKDSKAPASKPADKKR